MWVWSESVHVYFPLFLSLSFALQALRFLRQSVSKKQVLQKKEAMLDNVQNILHNIQNAETDALVSKSYLFVSAC